MIEKGWTLKGRVLNMNFRFFPVARLADRLSQHGFRIFRLRPPRFMTADEEEEGPEFFVVSRHGRVVAAVSEKFGKTVTRTYGNRARQLIAIAEQYGDVLAGERRSPKLPVDAKDVTGKLVAGKTLVIAILVPLMCLYWLGAWSFGCQRTTSF